jgi:hypothetical protein
MKPIFIKEAPPEYYLHKGYEKKISMGVYKCQCGNNFVARITKVKNGVTTSCGCNKNKRGWWC